MGAFCNFFYLDFTTDDKLDTLFEKQYFFPASILRTNDMKRSGHLILIYSKWIRLHFNSEIPKNKKV